MITKEQLEEWKREEIHELDLAVAEIERLQAFKDWVHAWLDSHGVPKEFPDGLHTKEGCRIGDRMDWLWEQIPFEQSKP